jgi:hypothetical protein
MPSPRVVIIQKLEKSSPFDFCARHYWRILPLLHSDDLTQQANHTKAKGQQYEINIEISRSS